MRVGTTSVGSGGGCQHRTCQELLSKAKHRIQLGLERAGMVRTKASQWARKSPSHLWPQNSFRGGLASPPRAHSRCSINFPCQSSQGPELPSTIMVLNVSLSFPEPFWHFFPRSRGEIEPVGEGRSGLPAGKPRPQPHQACWAVLLPRRA